MRTRFEEFVIGKSSLKQKVEELERYLIEKVMEHTGNNVALAARILKVSRTTLIKKLSIFKIKSM